MLLRRKKLKNIRKLIEVGGDILDLLAPFIAPNWLTQMLCYQGRNKLTQRMLAWSKTLYDHAIQTAVYAEIVGQTLGYQKNDLDNLTQGAFFHDIGKISWPKSFMTKQKPNNDDFKLMRGHPIAGEYYLSEIWPEVPSEVCRIVREHHERVDGSGYPKGLKNDEIYPLSIIVAAVEVFVALLEDRPYRSNCFTHKDALKELEKQLFPREIINILARIKIMMVEVEAIKRVSI